MFVVRGFQRKEKLLYITGHTLEKSLSDVMFVTKYSLRKEVLWLIAGHTLVPVLYSWNTILGERKSCDTSHNTFCRKAIQM
jgi:hypothetical protein